MITMDQVSVNSGPGKVGDGCESPTRFGRYDVLAWLDITMTQLVFDSLTQLFKIVMFDVDSIAVRIITKRAL